MNVTVDEIGPCRKIVRIEVPAEKVDAEYKTVLSQYAKRAKIKGFRPGKAPVSVVERMYKKQIGDDVKDRLVPESYQQAVKDQNLSVLSVLDVTDMSFALGQVMQFNVVVDVPPSFELPDYKSIKLEQKEVDVPESKVEETLTSILDQRATFEEVKDRAVAKGDLVQVDYSATCDGQPIEDMGEQTKGLGERKDFWVLANDDAFLPEFADGLAGAKPGDHRTITVQFADDFSVSELAGKSATYEVDVKAIREKKTPPLDEEFLKNLGMESEATLRERIKTDLESQARQTEMNRLRNAVVDEVLKNVDLDVPESSVSRESRQIMQDIIRENTMRGASKDVLSDKRDEIIEAANRNAKERVKAQFVLDRIADQENIQIKPDEFASHLHRLAARYGMTPDALRTELKKREAMPEVEAEFRRSLTIDFLLTQAGVSLT